MSSDDNGQDYRPDDDLLGFFGDAALAIAMAVLVVVGALWLVMGGC